MAAGRVKVLEQDSELGSALEGERLEQARAHAAPATLEIARGHWDGEARPDGARAAPLQTRAACRRGHGRAGRVI
jgi:hypothetical protein